jgi:hypothetical protein
MPVKGLEVDKVFHACNLAKFTFETTADLENDGPGAVSGC